MIPRYTDKEMESLFSDESRFETYLEVEKAATYGFMKLGVVPEKDFELIEKNAKVDVKRIQELEEITKHDVVAFTRQVSETLGEEKRWVHYGLTSTDVVDTSLSLLYQKANKIIEKDLNKLLSTIKELANEYKKTPCIGRSHGMHGDIISFGFKFLNYYDEILRGLRQFQSAKEFVECCMLSGAMGNYCNIDPQVQEYAAEYLHLNSAKVSTQVLSRDRHEQYASSLVILASSFEKIALEIRNLSRNEIQEVEEGFSKGQKGSSAMPQKRNPISSENITGCVRMMRGYLLPILEDNALFHERDISHSSVERVSLIDLITLFDYTAKRLNKVLENLVIFPERMLKNIYVTKGAIFSQRVMSALIEKGLSREQAYDFVQPLAMNAVQGGSDLLWALLENEDIKKYMNREEIQACFSIDYYLKNMDVLFERVLNQ